MKLFSGKRFFAILGAMALASLIFCTGAAADSVNPIWTNNYQGSDGTNAVVAVQGSKTFVAYSNEAGNNGRVEMYDNKGKQLPVYDLGDLGGGRITAIAANSSTVYVVGYTGVAGSGSEYIFSKAFKVSAKGLKVQWDTASPDPIPNAGLYPIGIKALGSKIVMFYNYNKNPSDLTTVQGQFMALDPKTGLIKWGPFDYGDPAYANKINAIAIKGSQFAAVGFQENAVSRYFSCNIYSAVKGDMIAGRGLGGAEDEALAVSWVGSYLGVAGQRSGASNLQGFFWGLKFSKNDLAEVWTDTSDLGGDTKMNAVALKGSQAFAGGHGKDSLSVESAIVKAFNLAPGTSKKPGGDLWSHSFTLAFSGGVVTTGLAVGKNGVYLAGYGKSDTSEDPTHKYWVVEAWDLKGKPTWDRVAINLNSGMFDQALDIAVGAKAVIAVGQVKNGSSGDLFAAVEAYTP